MPHITFVGSSLRLPESYEKLFNTVIFQFLWGKSEKERRSLCIKPRQDGGLAMPHISSRLRAIQCGWISKLRDKKGIFAMAFADTALQSKDVPGFRSPVSKLQDESDYPSLCVMAWTEALYLLDIDMEGYLWPHVLGEAKKLVKKRIPLATLNDVGTTAWTGLNFLEAATIRNAAKETISTIEDAWNVKRRKFRNSLAKSLSSEKLKPDSTPTQAAAEDTLQFKYGGRNIRSINTQRKFYWLFVDQIVSPPHKF
jgi:hypothetical protein